MKLINREVGYSVIALMYIIKNDRDVISATEIVEKLDVPKPFMRKILQILNKESVLISYKGKGGGFALAKPLEDIFLLNLIEIFQGGINLNECAIKGQACPCLDECKIKERIDRIQEKVISELKGVSLAELMEDKNL